MSLVVIPHQLFQQAAPLSAIGLEEHAWRLDAAISVLLLLEGSSVAVLGGDVYNRTRAGFEPVYENWYCDAQPGESPAAFATRSRRDAVAYIERLANSVSPDSWVSLVLSEALVPSEDPDRDDPAEDDP